MVDDVMPISGGDHKVAARLCNFSTGHATMLPTHTIRRLGAMLKRSIQQTG